MNFCLLPSCSIVKHRYSILKNSDFQDINCKFITLRHLKRLILLNFFVVGILFFYFNYNIFKWDYDDNNLTYKKPLQQSNNIVNFLILL